MGPGNIQNHPSPSKQTLPPNPHSFKTLIPLIQSSPQDLKPSLTKSIYFSLLHSSLNAPLHRSDFESVRTLSNILFEDLDRRFNQFFFSDLRDVFRGTSSSAKVWASLEQLILILRCCLVALNLLEFDPNLLWKKVRFLLLIVRVLVSLVSDSEKSESSVKFEKLFGDDDDGCSASVAEDFVASLCFLKPLDTCRPFLCALIEVLADELLINKSLRKCFMLVDSASGNEVLFMCHFGQGGVLEVVSVHFVLSVSDGHAFDNFINRILVSNWWMRMNGHYHYWKTCTKRYVFQLKAL